MPLLSSEASAPPTSLSVLPWGLPPGPTLPLTIPAAVASMLVLKHSRAYALVLPQYPGIFFADTQVLSHFLLLSLNCSLLGEPPWWSHLNFQSVPTPAWLISLPCFISISTYYIKYSFCLMSLFLSPVKCKLCESRPLNVLLTTVFPAPKTIVKHNRWSVFLEWFYESFKVFCTFSVAGTELSTGGTKLKKDILLFMHLQSTK